MLTEARTINILGTDVRVLFRRENEDPKLKTSVGYFDGSKSLIVIKILEPDENALGDLDKYQLEILRHEIIHAFFARKRPGQLFRPSRELGNQRGNGGLVCDPEPKDIQSVPGTKACVAYV